MGTETSTGQSSSAGPSAVAADVNKELLSTAEGQFYMVADSASEDHVRVEVHLRSGTVVSGWVVGMTGAVTFQVSETPDGYWPLWEIAFRDVVAIRRASASGCSQSSPSS